MLQIKYAVIHKTLVANRSLEGRDVRSFFKQGSLEYAENDRFLHVRVPFLRKYAKELASDLDWDTLQKLQESSYNEERALSLLILTLWYQTNRYTPETIVDWYIKNIRFVNNWNLVDLSAHKILGAYYFEKDYSVLFSLANSSSLWERRIAIVATWYHISKGNTDATFQIASLLLQDKEDLIHKATGWMLREAGKKHPQKLRSYLQQNTSIMSRTTLRYAIEKFPSFEKNAFMKKRLHAYSKVPKN